jgi:hypothetical protein
VISFSTYLLDLCSAIEGKHASAPPWFFNWKRNIFHQQYPESNDITLFLYVYDEGAS